MALMRRDLEVRIGDAEDAVDVGDAAVGGPLLLAADDVVVAVLGGRDGEAAGVGAGELLGQAEGDHLLAAAIFGSQRRFCSSVPPRMIGKEPRALTAKATPKPESAVASSSVTRHRARMPAPCPPYSTGMKVRKSPALATARAASQLYSCSLSYLAAPGRTCFSAISRASWASSLALSENTTFCMGMGSIRGFWGGANGPPV